MTYEFFSNLTFSISFFLYLFSFILYTLSFTTNKQALQNLGKALIFTAFSLHTAGLFFRWIAAGLDHPPMTNMYESLLFFIWCIVLVYLFFELKHKIEFFAVPVTMLVVVGMGLAALHVDKSIKPTMPALRSIWLYIHVSFAGISYAFFLLSAVIAVLFILKAQEKKNTISLVFTTFSFFCFALCMQKSLFFFFPLSLNELIFKDESKLLTGQFVEIKGFSFIAGIITLLFAFHMFTLFQNIHKKIISSCKFFIKPKLSFNFLFIAYFSAILYLSFFIYKTKNLSFSSNPFWLGIFILGFLTLVLQAVLNLRFSTLKAKLPSIEILDNLSYRSILIALPLLTLVIVTGSVWAHYAWGRYWGWDPKETWSLITWLIYALYLHLRLQRNWIGMKSAILSIIGFFSVIFTYLGVNILLSGLHSYG